MSNIELYLYIIYMLISFLYPYRPTSMCYTQVLYSNIYMAFFLWKKKNNKMVSSECVLFILMGRGGHRWALSISVLLLCQGSSGQWFSLSLALAVGMLLGHPHPRVPKGGG